MSLRPESWSNEEKMSATLVYSVYFPEDHEFIQNELLPGFYSDGRVEETIFEFQTFYKSWNKNLTIMGFLKIQLKQPSRGYTKSEAENQKSKHRF